MRSRSRESVSATELAKLGKCELLVRHPGMPRPPAPGREDVARMRRGERAHARQDAVVRRVEALVSAERGTGSGRSGLPGFAKAGLVVLGVLVVLYLMGRG